LLLRGPIPIPRCWILSPGTSGIQADSSFDDRKTPATRRRLDPDLDL
jgi:hypothetical protein